MAVNVSVRNTFLHFEDSHCTGSDEQPPLSRAVTQPVYVCRENRSGQLGITTVRSPGSFDTDGTTEVESELSNISDSHSGSSDGIVTFGENSVQAPILLGRTSACRAHECMGQGASKESSTSKLTKSYNVESLAQASQAEWTTLMIRNLPNQYTRDDFVSLLIDQGFEGRFDFVYFPIDFETHAAMGYAFVNVVSPKDATCLWNRLDGFSTWSCPCKKVCRISWSQPLQGLGVHVARYRNSPLMHELVPESYRPLLFAEGKRISFPPPTKKIKAPRKGSQRMLVPGA